MTSVTLIFVQYCFVAIYINASKEIARLETQLNDVEKLLQQQSDVVSSLGEVVATGSGGSGCDGICLVLFHGWLPQCLGRTQQA
jgi:D-arabinose 5-phosphate isomerase GutQ